MDSLLQTYTNQKLLKQKCARENVETTWNVQTKTRRGEIILDAIEIQEIIRTFTCQQIGQSRKKRINF